jgi:glycosyltransferase involved in cell wall biosynthesis
MLGFDPEIMAPIGAKGASVGRERTSMEERGSSSCPRTLIVDIARRHAGCESRVLGLAPKLPAGSVGIAGVDDSPLCRQARALGIPFHAVGAGKYSPGIVRELCRTIRENGYQVLDAQNSMSKLWGTLAAAKAGVALAFTVNGVMDLAYASTPKGFIYQRLEMYGNRHLDLCIAVSHLDRGRIVARWGLPDDAVRVVHNAIELDTAAIACEPRELRERFELPGDAIVCVAAGRLEWQKDYPCLIRAFARIANAHPRLHCLIMGEGHLRDKLQGEIERAGLGCRVRLLGFRSRDEVLTIVHSADMFVMSSHYEGTPVALLEAAALGKPIVASAVGGIPELVADGREALLFPESDSDAFAAALERFLATPGLMVRCGVAAARRVRAEFTTEIQARSTAACYREALSRARLRHVPVAD